MHSVSPRRGPARAIAAAAAALGLLLGLVACAPESRAQQASPKPSAPPVAETPEPEEPTRELLLASLGRGDEVAVIDPALEGADAVTSRIRVGAAPWGVGVHGETGYAATAEGLAVVDLSAGERTALVPFSHPAARIETGEYRPGGLGLAVAPDGSRVYVAATADGSANWLEVFDTERGEFVGSVEVGARPFDVLVAPDGSWAATVDHDGFSVTVVDAESLAATTHRVAPFGTEGGLASWEKPHYGAVAADGSIYLPYQGLVVVRLDPATGETTTIQSAANSHAHGTALAGTLLVTVGTGSFGNASGAPSLSILDIETGEERTVPLDPPHETVAVWHDAEGRAFAAAGGGNTRDEGWDGITLVALDDLAKREIPIPGYPQAVVSFTSR